MKSTSFTCLLLSAASLLCAPAYAATVASNYIYNGTTNWAPGGVASQSTTAYGAPAPRANDGIVQMGYGNNSVTHTDDAVPGTQNWQVDLTATRNVDQIRLTNRGEGINDRLSNFRLQVLNAAFTEVWGQDMYTGGGGVGDSELVLLPAGVNGQHVRVQQLGLNSLGNNILSLAEVEVIDVKTGTYSNIATAASASQASTGYGGVASRANDGNRDGFFGNNSVTHSDDSLPAGSPQWLDLDLGGDFRINELAVFNRQDCCWGRLGNFRLSIWDNGIEVFGQDFLTGDPLTAKGMLSIHEDTDGFLATGDKVRIELINGVDGTGFNNLHIAEFEVYGVAIPEPSVMALAGMLLIPFRRRRVR